MSRRLELLREVFEIKGNASLLTEREREQQQSGKIFLAGVIQRANARNGNGRVYPKDILQKEVENYNKLVRERRALGELDHADDQVVNLKNTSHVMTRLWWDGDDLYGVLEVIPTTSGQNLAALIQAEVTLGISSRGLGSTRNEGGNVIVEDDFKLICWDVVSDPSTHGAFLSLAESRKPVSGDTNLFTRADRIYRALNDFHMQGD
jgi:hypothetical protein